MCIDCDTFGQSDGLPLLMAQSVGKRRMWPFKAKPVLTLVPRAYLVTYPNGQSEVITCAKLVYYGSVAAFHGCSGPHSFIAMPPQAYSLIVECNRDG